MIRFRLERYVSVPRLVEGSGLEVVSTGLDEFVCFWFDHRRLVMVPHEPAIGMYQGPLFGDFNDFALRLRSWDAFGPTIIQFDEADKLTIIETGNEAMTLEECWKWYDDRVRLLPTGSYYLNISGCMAQSTVELGVACTLDRVSNQIRTVILEETC